MLYIVQRLHTYKRLLYFIIKFLCTLNFFQYSTIIQTMKFLINFTDLYLL